LTKGVWNTIDWESISRAIREIPPNRRCWMAKYILGHFATGKNRQRGKFQTLAQCPRCTHTLEDKMHILKCPSPTAHALWEKSLADLDKWLKDKGTNTHLCQLLIEYIRTWNEPGTTHSDKMEPSQTQDRIGKQYIWDGWLSIEW